MEVGLPARHVRPHRPDAPDPAGWPASSTPWCGGACPRQVDQDRLRVGGARRLVGAGRVPARRLRQRGGDPRRRQGAGAPDGRPREGDRRLPPRRPAVHERHRPPGAPALARSGRGRGQRAPGRLRARGDVAPRLPGRTPRPRGCRLVEGRAALGGAGQRAHGGGVEPGRREARRRRGPSGPWSAGPSPSARCSWSPDGGPDRLLDLAWLEMVRNAAHDSICACSVDEVVDAVLVRYAEASRIGDGLADQALGP